ncbi:helix-hairpin-helix domain-containing protein [Bisgaard Taxon 10/6]|uniref:helix-hairpin-helix domain-containing protein n=1 Tax=Exercitatus varius TaxID=67857 RepID=UPI00294B2907|nr:helix-hairpin-helix domain-containing protein [Exercitatus varius]MDG2947270.1 helix-hairpin-helix domain-containing protein [Exercitatus varius]
MNPAKVKRDQLQYLTDLPNVGEAVADDLLKLGINKPQDLIGRDAYAMYYELCELTGTQHDPCMIDVFLSLTDFMQGNEAKPWWKYSEQRKAYLQRVSVTDKHHLTGRIYCLLFNDYETLDLMGPVEFLHRLPDVTLHYVSQQGGLIRSRQGFYTETKPLPDLGENSVLLIPGGQGTRTLVNDAEFILMLKTRVKQTALCLTVCTGSALLAATGELNGLRATSNKRAFEWVRSVNPNVQWQPVARWVKDGKFYTSSGVSAGMDMALGFISDYYGVEQAQLIAEQTEYHWISDPNEDHFAGIYGY